MKKTDEQVNTWLFKVVIFLIVSGFLLSLNRWQRRRVHERSEHLLNDFHAQGTLMATFADFGFRPKSFVRRTSRRLMQPGAWELLKKSARMPGDDPDPGG
jgi:hypothetical protein